MTQRFRTLNVNDDFNHESLRIEIDTSLPAARVVRTLDELVKLRGAPKRLRLGNGPEFISAALKQWALRYGVSLIHIQPGKPTQNAYIERFNRTFREEVLDQHLFARLDDVREVTYWWMIDCNKARSHDSLGGMTPVEHRNKHAESSTFEMPA